VRTVTCDRCWAQVNNADGYRHLDWHIRLEREIKQIPEPPPVRKPL
jgi:hypothetical protein